MDPRHQWDPMIVNVQIAGSSDYISNLPDPLLCYILAFIPTKSAVATSILSKRWKTVWTKVPKLDFTEMPHLGSCCYLGSQEFLFENFVDKVLSTNDMSSIKVLRLHFVNGLRPRRATYWLSNVTRREIREIDLTCHCPSVKLPTEFFRMEKIVVLKLTWFSLDVPDSLHWPSLEYLHLVHAHFHNEKSLKNLVSGSPILKELAIDSCRGISMLCVSSSSLKTLEIKGTLTGQANPVLVIEAANLETLYLSDLADRYDLFNVSLYKAVLAIHDRRVNHREKLVELLKGICGLQILKLGRVTMEILQDLLQSELPAFSNLKLPMFRNLVCLEMTVGNWSVILQMLEYAPNLISLILYSGSRVPQMCNPPPSVHKCLLFTLREISVHHLTREGGGMKMVVYLLQNAGVLKKLKFCMAPYTCRGGYSDVVEKFSAVSSSRSSACEIVLCQSEH